jgi:heat shock protein HslJ
VGLGGIDWVLHDTSLSSLVAKVPPDVHIDLRFEGDQVSGSSGCNTYGASFQAIGGTISFGPFRSTAMACDHPVMALESAYLRALEGTTAYEVAGATLHLTGGAADLTFTKTAPSPSPT